MNKKFACTGASRTRLHEQEKVKENKEAFRVRTRPCLVYTVFFRLHRVVPNTALPRARGFEWKAVGSRYTAFSAKASVEFTAARQDDRTPAPSRIHLFVSFPLKHCFPRINNVGQSFILSVPGLRIASFDEKFSACAEDATRQSAFSESKREREKKKETVEKSFLLRHKRSGT